MKKWILLTVVAASIVAHGSGGAGEAQEAVKTALQFILPSADVDNGVKVYFQDKEEGKGATTENNPVKDGERNEEDKGESKQGQDRKWPPNLAELLGLLTSSAEEPWRPPTAGPLSTFTAPITDKGHLVIQPFFFYNWERGSFDEHSDYHSLPKGQMEQSAVGSLFMQYGLLHNIEVDAQFLLLHNRSSEAGESASETGLGDTLLILRYNLLHETTSWHPEISLLGQVKFPTGKFEHGDDNKLGTDIMGNGSYDLTLGLDFTKAARPCIFHADLWYSWPLERTVDGVKTRYGDYVNWNAAVEIPFWKEKLAYMLEFNGVHQANNQENGIEIGASRMKSIVLCTGMELNVSDKVQLLLAYQRTLWGTNADAYDSVVGTLVWNL